MSPSTCKWFTLCDNPAVTTEPHPVLGNVPICQRCADKLKRINATWDGAATVYARCETICGKLNAAEYTAQRKASKRPLRQFTPSAEAALIIEAMNKGDEERLKAFTYEYRHLWQQQEKTPNA